MWENSAGTSPDAADAARAMKLPIAPIGRNPNVKKHPQVVHPGGPPRSYETLPCFWRDAKGESSPPKNVCWDQLYADEFSGQ